MVRDKKLFGWYPRTPSATMMPDQIRLILGVDQQGSGKLSRYPNLSNALAKTRRGALSRITAEGRCVFRATCILEESLYE